MIKNKDLYRFKQGLESLYNKEIPVELSLKVIKNLRLINIELEDLEKVVKPSDAFLKEYQPKIESLVKEYCIKDESGNPFPKKDGNGSFVYDFLDENKVKFEKAIIELENREENKDILLVRKKQIEDFNKLLDKENDMFLNKIEFKSLPTTITPQQIDLIYELIQE